MSADTTVLDGPYCAACGDPAVSRIRLPDGRERPVCDRHERDGEVVGDA